MKRCWLGSAAALALISVALSPFLSAELPGTSSLDENKVQAQAAAAKSPAQEDPGASAIAALEQEAKSHQKVGRLDLAAELHEKIAKQLGSAKTREAISHFGVAIELRGALGQYAKQCLDLNLRGNLFRYMGDSAKARADYLKAQETAARHGDRAGLAAAISNLGHLEEKLGNFAAARLAYEQALKGLGDLEDAEETRVKILRNLAQVYRLEGNFEECGLLLERAQQLCTPALDGLRGALISDFGYCEHLMEHPANALGNYIEAINFLSRMTSLDQIVLFDRLGSNLLALKRPLEARQSFEYAIALAERADRPGDVIGTQINLCKISVLHPEVEPPNSPPSCEQALMAIQDERNPNLLASFYYWQSRHLPRLGRLLEAIEAGEIAVDLVDSLRSRIAGRNGRSRFLEDRSFYFRNLIDLLMRADQENSQMGFRVRALEVGERLRARTLLELWSEAGIDLLDSADAELRRELDDKLRTLELLAASRKKPGNQERISEALAQLDALDQRLRESSPNFLRVVRPPPFAVEEVQKQLGPDTVLALLSFGVETSYLFLLDAQKIRSFELAPSAKLEAAAEVYLHLLSDPGARIHRAALFRAGQQLARLLWGENGERLAGLPPRLVFLGDGKLQQFPISALPRPGSSLESPNYLVETFEVVHLPSLSLLTRSRVSTRQAPTKRAILLADPVYRLEARSDIRMLPLLPADLERFFPRNAMPPSLGRLPFADVEAEHIRARFGTWPIDIELGPRASKKLALSPKIGLYSILHLSSHGWRDEEHSELSALMLSEVDEAGQTVDGKLRLHDLYQLRLRADLVVASACQTGIGGNLRLEGVGGLAQGFFHAGARRTLVSLWQVESESTAILMDHFYQHLLEGDPPGQALREASLDLIALSRPQRNDWDLPFYWSPFILIGDWTAFKMPKDSPATNQSRQIRVDKSRTPNSGMVPN